MAAPTEAQIAHQKLLDDLDIHSVHKTFRAPSWRPNHRRNKNIKTIMMDASRKEASSSAVATPQDVSGTVTPNPASAAKGSNDIKDDGLSTSGSSTPANNNESSNSLPPNLAQASRSLSKLVLEKSLRQSNGVGQATLGGPAAPNVTYTNIESAPSLAHTKHYCDVTGLPAPYTDPKTRLRYHDREVFGFLRTLPQSSAEQYLEARGAHVVLK